MASVGTIVVPQVRWGGRWKSQIEKADVGEEWVPLTAYGRTTSYQVARHLNLYKVLPELPDGFYWEFGAREEIDGQSTLLVRKGMRDGEDS